MLFSSWCSLPFVQVNFGIFLHVMRRDVRCMQDLQNLIFGGLTLISFIIHIVDPRYNYHPLYWSRVHKGRFVADHTWNFHMGFAPAFACYQFVRMRIMWRLNLLRRPCAQPPDAKYKNVPGISCCICCASLYVVHGACWLPFLNTTMLRLPFLSLVLVAVAIEANPRVTDDRFLGISKLNIYVANTYS